MSKPNENPSGQPIGGQWAQQQKQGLQNQEPAASTATRPQLSDEEQTKLEQEVVDETNQETGDAENTSRMPEKQGGIGGP